ncbi:hypothetical protein ACFYMO_29465, partial [Streptomyces sp. NPDC007025]
MHETDSGTSSGAARTCGIVRVPRFLGFRVLDVLPSGPGAVIVDPQNRTMYFITEPDTGLGQELQGVEFLAELPYLTPPAARLGPPGPYWLVEPGDPWRRTNPVDLHQALSSAVRHSQGDIFAVPLSHQRGDYVVDEATRQRMPPEPAWVGRVQTVLDAGHV